MKEDNNYYPIFQIFKNASDKKINLVSIFNINTDEIIPHLLHYMNLSCENISFSNIKIANAKNIYYTLQSKNISNIIPVSQIIDLRNKCKYLVTKDGFLIPTKPSGTIQHLPYTTHITNVKTLHETITFLKELQKYINIIPYGFIYISNDKISDHKLSTTYQIEAIIVDTQISVPIIPITIKKEELDKLLPNNILESRSLYDIIDHEIEKGSKNIEIDKRIEDIHLNKYYNEHYELFRFELSNYLNLYQNIKNKIIKILETKDINKVYEIKKLLFKITSDTLYNNFLELIKENDKSDNETINLTHGGHLSQSNKLTHGGHLSQSNKLTHGGHLENKIVNIMTEKLDLTNYNIKNNRELCVNLNNKDECNINLHCTWIKNKCLFNVEETKLIEFIARITDELINNELKSKEILNIDLSRNY